MNLPSQTQPRPPGWRPLKYFCAEPPQYGLNVSSSEYTDHNSGGLRLLRTTDINEDGSLTFGNEVYINPEGESPNYRLTAGDLLLSRSGTLGRSFLCTTSSPPSTFAGYLIRFRPKSNVDPRYLNYCSRATFFEDGIKANAVSSTIANFNAERYGSLQLPWRTLAEQRAIADYLDAETARIDTLISKKRRLIELLQERWRSEVMNTIFQQSHSVRRAAIRHVVDLLPGYAFTSSEFAEEGIRLLRGLNIAPGRLRWDSDVVYVAAEDRPQYSEYELAEGDIVLGMDRPVIASGMRVASVSPSDLPCLLVQRVARIRTTKHADIRYIRFILESDAFVAYFSPISTGVSVPHISADQVLSFRAPLPSRGVQSALATQLAKNRRILLPYEIG